MEPTRSPILAVFVLIATLAYSLPVYSQDGNNDPRKIMSEAFRARFNKNYKKCNQLLQRCLRYTKSEQQKKFIQRQILVTYHDAAMEKRKQGDYKKAVALLKTAEMGAQQVGDKKFQKKVLNLMGEIYEVNGKNKSAVDHYMAAESYFKVGMLYMKHQKYQSALKIFEGMVKSPNYPKKIFYVEGAADMIRGNKPVTDDQGASMRLSHLAYIGGCYEALGDTKTAMMAYNGGLSDGKQFKDCQAALGRLYLKNRKYEDAYKIFRGNDKIKAAEALKGLKQDEVAKVAYMGAVEDANKQINKLKQQAQQARQKYRNMPNERREMYYQEMGTYFHMLVQAYKKKGDAYMGMENMPAANEAFKQAKRYSENYYQAMTGRGADQFMILKFKTSSYNTQRKEIEANINKTDGR